MEIKSAIKYQMMDAKKPLIIFYSIIYTILIIAILSMKILTKNGGGFNFNGIETSSMIFIFIAGLNSFKETFRMFLQNSLSRKTMFISWILSVIPIAAFMALIDSINGIVVDSLTGYQSAFMQFYGQRYIENSSNIQGIIEGFFWSVLAYSFLVMLGFFITTLYYRMNKAMKLLVSIGVPALIIIIIPFIDATFTNGAIYSAIGNFFGFAWGYNNGFNPYYSMVTCTLFFALFAGLSYLLIRRATIKE